MANIQLVQSNQWTSHNGVYFRGICFYQGKKLSGEDACEFFSEVKNNLEEKLSNISGFFSIIIEKTDSTTLITDPIQSIPLFYNTESGEICVSENYRYLEDLSSINEFDTVSAIEFLLAGYVPGPDTIHPHIKKTQPAEIVEIDKASGNIYFSTNRYYSFTPTTTQEQMSKNELFEQIDSTLSDCADRFKTALNGRPVILALSSGFDSRLLAHMLHQHGFEDVNTYTYNRYGEDLNKAKKISEGLGFEWVGFEHTQKEVYQFYRSNHFQEIEEMAGGHGTLHPNPVSSLNMKKINESVHFPDNGVILKGHTPAEAGKRLLDGHLTKDQHSLADEKSNIIRKNYYRRDVDTNTKRTLEKRVHRRIAESTSELDNPNLQLTEFWYWNQRIPNRLMFPQYSYKYWGYDIWYPFCDRAYLNLYCNIPVGERYKRKIYEDYTRKKDSEHLPQINFSYEQNKPVSKIKRYIRDSPFEGPARTILKLVSNDSSTDELLERLGFAFLDKQTAKEIHTGSEDSRYFFSLFALARSKLEPREDFPMCYKEQYKLAKEYTEQTRGVVRKQTTSNNCETNQL